MSISPQVVAGSPPGRTVDWAQYGTRPRPLGFGGYAGIPWGPGLPIQIAPGWTGFDETPQLVVNDQQRASGDGTISSRAYTGPRTVTVPFVVLADSTGELQQMLATLEMAWDPDGQTWDRLWAFDGNRFLNAQVRNRAFTQVRAGLGQRVATGSVQFYAADPYWYGPDQAFQLQAQTSTGGMQFPMPFPMVFGTTSHGSGTIYNPGLRTPVHLTIPGPCTRPFVGSDTQGVGMTLGITLNTGDFLDIDSGTKSITLNGTARRNDLMSGTNAFFDLLHGNNQLRFRSSSGGSSEIARGSWNPRWR